MAIARNTPEALFIRKIYALDRNSMVDSWDNLSIMCRVQSGRCISVACKELLASQ